MGRGGGIEADVVVSMDESGMSDMAMTGRAAQMMPELVGRGPVAAVMAIGDIFLNDTPLMDTSVGLLISSGLAGTLGAGGRGCARGWMVASRGWGVEDAVEEDSPAPTEDDADDDGGLADLLDLVVKMIPLL